jgi:hypothetical protein
MSAGVEARPTLSRGKAMLASDAIVIWRMAELGCGKCRHGRERLLQAGDAFVTRR